MYVYLNILTKYIPYEPPTKDSIPISGWCYVLVVGDKVMSSISHVAEKHFSHIWWYKSYFY